MPMITGSSLATQRHDHRTTSYLPFCETSIDGHRTPTAKSCHRREIQSFENTMVVAANGFPAPLFLTFFTLSLSPCDNAITSPEHSFKVFRLSGWTITRFAQRDSPSEASDKEAVNLGTDICLVKIMKDGPVSVLECPVISLEFLILSL